MKPEYIENYTENIFNELLKDLNWISTGAPRDEYFMSENALEYTYGSGRGERTYSSSLFHPLVKELMERMNKEFDCKYDICFLNYYSGNKNHLGWHADDSPEMDSEHPIASVSYGAERSIYWKHKDYKGVIPPDQQQLLGSGSLFVMPKGFQKDNLHKIPKHSCACVGRISLTFRHYVNKE